jgi:hypothetical protein
VLASNLRPFCSAAFGTVSSISAFYFGNAGANGVHLRPMLGLWAGLLALLHGSVTLSTHGLWIDPLQKCAMEREGQSAEVMIEMLMNCVASLTSLAIISFRSHRHFYKNHLSQPFDSFRLGFACIASTQFFIDIDAHMEVYTWTNQSLEKSRWL